MDSKEKAMAKAGVVTEVLGPCMTASDHARRKPKVARLALAIAIESWDPVFEHCDPEFVRKTLVNRVKPQLAQRMKDDPEIGFIMTITLSMIFGWIMQAIIVTAVAQLVIWWLNRKLERGKLLESLVGET